jgi:predicted N-acetyltransferase YhbS
MRTAPDTEVVVPAHEQRLAGLDPLLPRSHPLPDPQPGDEVLTVPGGVAIARRERPDLTGMAATWGAADQHRLLPRVAGPEPEAAMAGLLARWCDLVRARATPDDPDSEAVLTWPSRDAGMAQLLLGYGLVPLAVVAARLPGRPGPAPAAQPGLAPAAQPGLAPAGQPEPRLAGATRPRPLAPGDLAAARQRWLEVIRWDAQFNLVGERPATAGLLDQELREAVTREQPWAWVADLDQPVAGLLMIEPPERAGWIAPLVSASPAAYLGTLVVAAGQRGQGAGASLVAAGHRALDAAGVAVTLLHYATLNPLSGPFWHRCGYRPLWTIWRLRPASRLGAGRPR